MRHDMTLNDLAKAWWRHCMELATSAHFCAVCALEKAGAHVVGCKEGPKVKS